MRRTYVRGHYRRRRGAKKRHTRKGFVLFILVSLIFVFVIISLIIRMLLVAVNYISSLPPIFYIFACSIAIAIVALFVTIKFRQIQQRKQQEVDQNAHQQYLDQSQQQQIGRQQQKVTSEIYAAQAQVQQHREKTFQVRTLGEILVLTPGEFEEFVGKVFRSLGYSNVLRVGGSGDLGVDLTAIDPEGRKVVIQCKRYAPRRTIGTPDLQSFIGMAFIHHKAEIGIFVTTSTFKQTARALAKQHSEKIRLVDGEGLVKLVGNGRSKRSISSRNLW